MTRAEAYAEKLRDPRWLARREEILVRDERTCRTCFSLTPPLDVHHLLYLPNREPWDYPDELLETRCRKCHSFGHGIGLPSEEQSDLTELRRKWFAVSERVRKEKECER